MGCAISFWEFTQRIVGEALQSSVEHLWLAVALGCKFLTTVFFVVERYYVWTKDISNPRQTHKS